MKMICASGRFFIPTILFLVVCGFGDDNRYFFAEDGVQERGFPYIRASDDRDISGMKIILFIDIHLITFRERYDLDII